MSYRNINVDGATYKFVIGKTYTKVVGVGSILNSELGIPLGNNRYFTQPRDVRRFIIGAGKIDKHFHDGPHECNFCDKISDDVCFRTNPFETEIHERAIYAYCCDNCDKEIADNI